MDGHAKYVSAALLLGAVVAAACGSRALGAAASAEAEREAKQFSVPAGKAVVHLYGELHTMNEWSGEIKAALDNREIGTFNSGQFIRKVVEPGPHSILIEGPGSQLIPTRARFEAEADQKYFIHVRTENVNVRTYRMTQSMEGSEIAEKVLRGYRLQKWGEQQ